jgi:SAM-dependent methyltransferase
MSLFKGQEKPCWLNVHFIGRSIFDNEPIESIILTLKSARIIRSRSEIMTQLPDHCTGRLVNYIKYRPRYPRAILDLLKEECGQTGRMTIADNGCGTGLLAELFLQNGYPVLGIEPDPDMGAGAEFYLQDYTNFTGIKATAEATTLPDQTLDFVTVGQAFHWFNLERTRPEFQRILAPTGWLVLVWNVQLATGTPFLEAL